MRKKYEFLILIIALLSTFCLTGCGGDDAETYEMKIAHLCVESDSMHQGALYLEEILEEKSEGRIAVEIFPNKQLSSSDQEMIEACRNGSVEMAITTSFYVASTSTELKHLNIFDYPYLFETSEELYAFCNSELGKSLDQEVLELSNGLKTYGIYTPAWYKIGTVDKPVDSLDDLAGQKIRSTGSDISMATLRAFGANPTLVNYGEVYTALQQGTIDGNATAVNLMLTEKYYEVMPNITVTNQMPHILCPAINVGWYESLPADLQAIVDECMTEYIQWIRDYGVQVEEDSLAELENVANVIYLDDAEKAKFIEAAKPVWEECADVAGAEYLEEVIAFLEDYRANK